MKKLYSAAGVLVITSQTGIIFSCMQPSITTRCQTFESQIEEILSRSLEAIYFSSVPHMKMKQYPFKLIHQDNDGKTYFDVELLSRIRQKSQTKDVISALKSSNIQNSLDNSGNGLLHIAAQYDNKFVTQHLIRSGSKVDVQNTLGKTPLMLAIENHCKSSTDILLEANANTLITDNEGKTALHWFFDAQWLHLSYLVWKFLHKVESQCQNNSKVIVDKLYDAEWSIPCLALLENIEVIEMMLKRGCQVDAREPVNNRTALHEAVLTNDVQRVNLLLDYGADPNAMDWSHRTPLYYVYDRNTKHSNDRLEIVKLLIGKGASTVTSIDGHSWIQVELALRYANSEVIKILLQANLDLTKEDGDGNTLLHILASNRNPDVYKALEDWSFNVHAYNVFLESPLFVAASIGNARMVEFLLKRGADAQEFSCEFCSPLYRCIERFSSDLETQWKECIQSLLEYGADPEIACYVLTDDASTVFDVVQEKKIYAIGELLIAHLVLREVLGKPIDEYISEYHIQSHLPFTNYYEFCKKQLKTKFYKSLTLLDLLTKSDVKFEHYARDQQFVSNVENFNDEWKSKLFYYNRILQRRFSKAAHKLKLKGEAAVAVCKIMKTDYSRFPLIADQIVSYLHERDLRNLSQMSFNEY